MLTQDTNAATLIDSDVAFLLSHDQERQEFIVDHRDILLEDILLLQESAKYLSLSEWNKFFIYAYDPEAAYKGWRETAFQDTLGSIWDQYQKSRVLAPREHLKTHTALSYVLKRVFTREYPLEINYYHISGELAAEKFNKLRLICERNPYLRHALDIQNARSWSSDRIELSDGTIILPLSYQQGVVGKHPHIIILDDIIDVNILYSDDQNKKAIDKFYANIYPQISKEDPDRKIIILGTSQREDDIYQKLPDDFKVFTFSAVVDDETQQVLSPEIFTYSGLMKIKKDISSKLGEKFWLKEYMNVPMSALGMIIKAEWIKFYKPDQITLEMQRRMTRVQGWDISVGKDLEKNDYTAKVTIDVLPPKLDSEVLKIYIRRVYRARLDFPKRIKAIKDGFDEDKPVAQGVEDVAFQYDTIQTARTRYALPIMEIKAIKDKVQSFQVELAPYFENGQVYMLEEHGEGEDSNLKHELLSLPMGEFDDMCDALKIAIKTYLFNIGGNLTDSTTTERSEDRGMGDLREKDF